jgi:RecA/RadA recombinase
MGRRTKRLAKQIEGHSPPPETKGPCHPIVPTGSTMLNLACSDRVDKAFSVGRMANIIGDSSTGKTLLCLSILAEMAMRPEFDEYRFIFDDVECANEFNIVDLFGQKVADRLEPAAVDKDGEEDPSDCIENFHFNIINALDHPKPFIYILDSMDALDALADRKKLKESKTVHDKYKKAMEKGTEKEQKQAKKALEDLKGSYGAAKARINSQILRNICKRLKKTKSVLIIVSQTRDVISAMSFAEKTRSGGRALKFYAFHEMWLAYVEPIRKNKIEIGAHIKIKLSKNKVTGKKRIVEIPIYPEIGIDDIRSQIDFIVSQGVWKTKKQRIVAIIDGKEITKTPLALTKHIEDNNLEEALKEETQLAWDMREESLKLNRKRKYK